MRFIAGLLRSISGDRRRRAMERRAAAEALECRDAGLRLVQSGDASTAHQKFARAVELVPRDPDGHALLANVLYLKGEPLRAESEYRRALEIAPDHLSARSNYGLLLRDQGRVIEALHSFETVLERDPGHEAALRGLASLAATSCDRARLLEAARLAVARAPASGLAHATLGFLLLKTAADPQGALDALDAALAFGHGNADTLGNRAIALQDLGRIDEALRAYDTALVADPANVVVRWHRAVALLLVGRYAEAWDDYEQRLRSADRAPRLFPQPRWNGESLEGKALLVHAEQGLGDEIMFASCYGELIAQARHCIIECNPKLEALFRRSFPQASVRAGAQDADVSWVDQYPRAELQCPAGSVPRYLRRDRGAFPQHAGYLRAEPARIDYWRDRLARERAPIAVGISWRGGTRVSRSPMRSMALQDWLPTMKAKDALWVSLQYDASEDEVRAFSKAHGVRLVHWPEAIADYDETAALVCALDLVASVCTAVIHLGGALGRPVSVLAPVSPEWRYGLASERMDWYPSVRVHRQSRFGDWAQPLERLRTDLRAIRDAKADC